MKNHYLYALAWVALTSTCSVALANDDSTFTYASSEDGTSATITAARETMIEHGMVLAIFGEHGYTLVDGACIAEHEGTQELSTTTSASVDHTTVKIIVEASIAAAVAGPELLELCGPYDDCLPCPQNIYDEIRYQHDVTQETQSADFEWGVFPEGCGGGDGPGGRAPASCEAQQDPCATICTSEP